MFLKEQGTIYSNFYHTKFGGMAHGVMFVIAEISHPVMPEIVIE